METPYADKTFRDRSRLKRYLQSRRLRHALQLAQGLPDPGQIIDFGAGNGELCKLLAARYAKARVICYEPHPGLLAQARENLSGFPSIEFAGSLDELPDSGVDLLFCLEVFEHLPPMEMEAAFSRIGDLLDRHGNAIFGVPVEIGLPALFKGLFRWLRRPGQYDTNLSNIFRSLMGRPPTDRPSVELMPGSHYHLHHVGFDYREFRALLAARFTETRYSCSPMSAAPPWINAELNLLVTPRQH